MQFVLELLHDFKSTVMYKIKKAICNLKQLKHEIEDGIWVYAMLSVFKDRFYFQE